MTKSTKIIAALGVAAGLGIASLPAGAIFAVDPSLLPLELDGTSSADVTVQLTVGSSIALGVSANECTGDSDAATAGIQNFQISDTGKCEMSVAGGTNDPSGFVLSVASKSGYSPNLRLGATYPSTFTETDQNTIKGNDGVTINGSVDSTAGWNMTAGLLSKKAVTAAAQNVMITDESHQYQIPVTYDFGTRSDQEAGHYSTIITYTIAANDSHLTAGGSNGFLYEYPAGSNT